MKKTIAILVFSALGGCAMNPSTFAYQCELDGHGPGTSNHRVCAEHYSRVEHKQRLAKMFEPRPEDTRNERVTTCKKNYLGELVCTSKDKY